MPIIPELWRLKPEDSFEFEARLDYIAGLRLVWTILGTLIFCLFVLIIDN